MLPKLATGKLPTELVVLAGVLMALGAIALGQTLYGIFSSDSRTINAMILLLAAGYGLLRLSTFWRMFTQVIALFLIIFMSMPLLNLLMGRALLPQGTPILGQVIFWVQTLLGIGVSIWAIYVLRKPSIDKLFDKPRL